MTNWFERRRTKTNPRKADTDGDGVKDGVEVRRTKTNPRKADTDGDGVNDGDEVAAGSDPSDPSSIPVQRQNLAGPPAPLPPSSLPKAAWTAPTNAQVQVPVTLDGTASTGSPPLSCTWSFENQSGSIVWLAQEGCRIDFTFESSGIKYVKLTVQNAAGESDSNKQSFDVATTSDTAPPNTTIGSGPSGTTTATSASFSFSSSESNSTFQCQLNGSAWASCSSPKAYSGLAEANHTFSVRATDAAGNTDPTPATREWTVSSTPPPPDTTPPETTIVSSPPSTTTSTSASFSFNSTESGSSFECQLDGAAFGSCNSPKSYSGLSVGSHTFTVRATDPAGNVDPTPASWSWTVQSPPPPPPSGCVAGATQATTAAQVRSAVQGSNNVCVVAAVGDVNLSSLGSRPVVISTESGGSMGFIDLRETTDVTIRSARFRSVELRGSHRTKLLGNVIGGTQSNRVYDQLIFMPETNNDV